eukprot:TRINITY_DN3125_c0_g1_i1.p1 TRINITY_DN3125_c0_g1~~TRINITY_DN3125_c0_g1_i1.p1  ORF type:complete len:405 (-),score=187.32 TRINITY_DN3125_c0_g1_i1:118-1332(-)
MLGKISSFFSFSSDNNRPPPWNPQQAKIHLRLAESRIKLQKNKKENLAAQQKKEIAQLIADGKEETARVRTEALIMEERMIEALGQLVLIAELLLVRIDAIGMNEQVPPDLHEPVSSIIFAAPRVDVKELKLLSRNLSNKYGKEYSESAASNREQQVNARLAVQLALDRPKHSQLYKVMRAACDTYHIEWNDQHMLDLIAQVEGASALVESESRDHKSARDQSSAPDQAESAEHSEDEDALMAELSAYQSTRPDTRHSAADTSDLPDVPEPDFDEPEPVPVTKQQVSSPTSGPSSTSSRQSSTPSTRSTAANTAVTRVKPSAEDDLDLFASNFPQIPSTKTSPGTRSVPPSNANTMDTHADEDEHDLEAKLPRVKTDPRDKKRDSSAGMNDDDLMARFQALKKK